MIADANIRAQKAPYKKTKYPPLPDNVKKDYLNGKKTISQICKELNISYYLFWKRLRNN